MNLTCSSSIRDQPGTSSERPNLSNLEDRLKTFDTWPKNAPIQAVKLARAGFYYTKNNLLTKCYSCKTEYGDWQFADSVMGKHKALSPECEFVKNVFKMPQSRIQDRIEVVENNITSYPSSAASHQVNGLAFQTPRGSILNRSTSLPISRERLHQVLQDPLLKLETERLKTFRVWPLGYLRPIELSRAGFYYLQEGDKVKCAYCGGVIYNWKPGDIPLQEHAKHFPNCPFILSPDSLSVDECGGYNHQNELSVSERNVPGYKTDSDPFTKLGITFHSSPKHPSQASPDARMRSFANWPKDAPLKPESLVKAGFFYINMHDYTKCFHCDGGLCNWEAGDDPWTEHARWFPKCEYVRLIKGDAFIGESIQKHREMLQSVASAAVNGSDVEPHMVSEIETIMSSNDVKFYMTQGVPYDTLKQAIKNHILTIGRGFNSREELIEMLSSAFSLNSSNTRVVSSTSNMQHNESEVALHRVSSEPVFRPVLTSSFVANIQNTSKSEAIDPNALKEENQRLKEQHLCKICLDQEVGIVFLPCGHLVSCPSCAASLKDCPMCRRSIMGTVRTFLS